MSPLGSTLYGALVRYAEGGERVREVLLPEPLFSEYLLDIEAQHLMGMLKVSVKAAKGLDAPRFHMEES